MVNPKGADSRERTGHGAKQGRRSQESPGAALGDAGEHRQAVCLVALYDEHQPEWLEAATETMDFIAGGFPAGSKIRRDDVAKALIPILEVHETLKKTLESNKLRGKFWIKDFADLIIDRTWDELEKRKRNAKKK
jgi:hypothetical protein